MCYHGGKTYGIDDLADYYEASNPADIEEVWKPRYHESGFSHLPSPVVLPGNQFGYFLWGLIPHWVKTLDAKAVVLRRNTLNCISEEMFEKPSFRDAVKKGQRCLIPLTGFFETRHDDEKGKNKTPHYIFLPGQKIFSVAGLYSIWTNRETDEVYHTYTMLTTAANPLMAKIHNTKKRMPVIIPREHEKDWLNPNLTKDDVLAFCKPFDENKMEAYEVSKLVNSRTLPTNVPEVSARLK